MHMPTLMMLANLRALRSLAFVFRATVLHRSEAEAGDVQSRPSLDRRPLVSSALGLLSFQLASQWVRLSLLSVAASSHFQLVASPLLVSLCSLSFASPLRCSNHRSEQPFSTFFSRPVNSPLEWRIPSRAILTICYVSDVPSDTKLLAQEYQNAPNFAVSID